MKQSAETSSSIMIHIAGFIKTDLAIQKVLGGGGYTETETA
jgi:hypothetical protein